MDAPFSPVEAVMKVSNGFLSLAVLMAAQSAMAANTLIGTWTLQKRVCASGVNPSDKFAIGRDALKVEIATSKGATLIRGKLLVNGILQNYESRVESRGFATSTLNPFTGKQDLVMYEQPTANELEVISAGFAQNDVCPQGDRLKSIFARIAN
jgi:hypothetical protein